MYKIKRVTKKGNKIKTTITKDYYLIDERGIPVAVVFIAKNKKEKFAIKAGLMNWYRGIIINGRFYPIEDIAEVVTKSTQSSPYARMKQIFNKEVKGLVIGCTEIYKFEGGLLCNGVIYHD